MREIIRMQAGSHLYGTSVPESDEDQKGVFIPSGPSILLQRAEEGISTNEDGIDLELFSLHKYLKLLLEGQTVALDMLFTPEKFYLQPPEPEWYAIMTNKEKFLCKGVSAFVGYCRAQVRKYVVKVDRYAATSATVATLTALCATHFNQDSLGQHMDSVERLASEFDHIEVGEIQQASAGALLHLEVAGTKVPLTASIKTALEMFKFKLDKYGARVRQAKDMDGKDWKGVMHAVRVAYEALEFLETGKLVFPRPEASLLMAIRMGKIPYDKVAQMIEDGLVKVEEALEASSLPEEPDREFADSLIEEFYRSAVRSARSSAG